MTAKNRELDSLLGPAEAAKFEAEVEAELDLSRIVASTHQHVREQLSTQIQ
eukprot:CAMPEP_0113972030 /NCGR_PEP_ID=MMETSP0011_2-20120614/12872_1 /TAXON_ID=101924 /ORGANISM="Rhodosorus marinus" /LENGTH=50 /DNA_ID=CAMNT_0000988205 /DNA_START=411 /DNA_END=561 /DNA_ORIENTATION=- /assembly_acc=CAM_ASM_000156